MSLSPSQKQERRLAALVGGRTTPGSGNTPTRKNDVRTLTHSYELKTTTKQSYSLKSAELKKGEQHALLDGRDFVFGIEMDGRHWIVLSEEDYLAMLHALEVADGSEGPFGGS